MIRVLLVEDEPMWQGGIRALLDPEPDMDLIGVVNNANDAEIWVTAEEPDVVLVDWKILGPRDGLALADALTSKLGTNRIILVTGSPPEQIPPHPYRYVAKSRIASALVDEIRLAVAVSREAR